MRIERIEVAESTEPGGPREAARRLRELVPGPESVASSVAEIIEAVRLQGDTAVAAFTRRFDTREAEPLPLLVAPEELDAAIRTLPLDVVAGLQVTIANVAEVAAAAVRDDSDLTLAQGHRILTRELPVASAAVYVPGGRAPYPSTVAMGVVTARAAGVLDVAVCSPPGPGGDIAPAILGTCRLCGVETVYRMGGAQAIAALAHGTEAVCRVDVVVGPGNLYVQEAKRQLSGVVGIDGFAGPSDLMIVLTVETAAADRNEADPNRPAREITLAVLDLLAQAEHGADSLVACVSPSPDALDALAAEIERLAAEHPELKAPCALVHVPSARAAIELANAFAPEHLQLIGPEAERLAPLVTAAGCLFVGAGAGTAFGDYVAGSNHVLPTAGAARFSSTLSPSHFRRRMSEVHIGPAAAAKLAAAGAPIARAEGFELHARSMEARAAAPFDLALGENQAP